MCRYGFSQYKQHYACFNCRKVFRKNRELLPAPPICPECSTQLRGVGLDFKAPRQSDVKQWQKVRILLQNGIDFNSCGCGPGYRPATLRELPDFLRERETARLESLRADRLLVR